MARKSASTSGLFRSFATNAVYIAGERAVCDLDSVLAEALVNCLEGVAGAQCRINLSPCPSNLGHWLVWTLAPQGMEAGQKGVLD